MAAATSVASAGASHTSEAPEPSKSESLCRRVAMHNFNPHRNRNRDAAATGTRPHTVPTHPRYPNPFHRTLGQASLQVSRLFLTSACGRCG